MSENEDKETAQSQVELTRDPKDEDPFRKKQQRAVSKSGEVKR